MLEQAIKFLCLILSFIQMSEMSFAKVEKKRETFHPHFFNAKLLKKGEHRGSILGDYKVGLLPRLQLGTQLALDFGGLLNLNFKHHMFDYNSGKATLSFLGGAGTILPGFIDENFNQGLYGKGGFFYGTLMTSRRESQDWQSNFALTFVSVDWQPKLVVGEESQIKAMALLASLGFDYKLSKRLFSQGTLFFPLGKIIQIETDNNILTNRYFNENYQVPGQFSLSYMVGSWILEMAYYFPSLAKIKKGLPLFNLSYYFRV